MRHLAISTLVLLIAALTTVGACNSKKKSADQVLDEASGGAATAPATTLGGACASNEDCSQGEVCLAQVCASTAPGAIYTDPHNAVTSDKVKAQMDMINKAAEDRVEKILNEAE
jgi:hypothetical protein